MNKPHEVNRVEIELAHWQSKEARFEKYFQGKLADNRALLTAKLQHYEGIIAKYKSSKSLEEVFAVRLVLHERKKIVKQLFPNFYARILRKLIHVLFVGKIREARYNREQQQNRENVIKTIMKTGFKDAVPKVNEQMRNGLSKFEVPVNYYLNENERVIHRLFFSKNQNEQYEFDGYRMTMYNELNPDGFKEHFFKADGSNVFNLKESFNLLSGRAVEKDGKWLQLDLCDRNGEDNYRVKEFHSDFAFDLEKTILSLPLEQLRDESSKTKLFQSLREGNLAEVTFSKNKSETRYIACSPQFRSVNIYNENLHKISLAEAVNKKYSRTVRQNEKPVIKLEEKESRNKVKKIIR
ncbi:hypothetical protein [Flavobacterium sp. CF136]|uniref:hypothetical protein n=1 Tax=Flavobacterium sp. (strain CF136) TaxID=1144313 RepID=UPI0002718E46|nr:hypothetical protein [Flavobacterium sp. CF136]EJL62815.1 hypothetical protein PMI10_02772 [Flavobacterium sp. CF136]